LGEKTARDMSKVDANQGTPRPLSEGCADDGHAAIVL